MKRKNPTADATAPASGSKRSRTAKNTSVSVHKRPIVCPPDKAGRHPLFRIGGLICRALVIWLAAAGLVTFLSDAIQSGVPAEAIFITSFAVVVLGMVFTHSGIGKIISSLLAVGGIGAWICIRPKFLVDLPFGFVTLYNTILNRLNRLGYFSYAQFRVDVTQFTDTMEDLLALEAMCIFTAVITLIFVASLARRVHLVPPAILSTSLIAVVLTFNIYSNSIESNLGIALVIVSFAAVLVMGAYDRLYNRTDSRQYDTELQLFEDTDRPTLPPEYSTRQEARRRRTEERRRRRERPATIDEDISGYFATGRKKPAPEEPTDDHGPDDREIARRVREVKRYDRVTEESKTAMGGYAAGAVVIACLLAIIIPATTISGNFSTIPAIDEKVQLARDYVTALLQGDEKALDRLDYMADGSHFRPHSTTAEQLKFTGQQIFYIQTRYNTNYYLRGWVGVDYQNGAWHAVDSDTLNLYHQTFGQDASPAEEMKYDFYYYMKPELVTTTPSTSDRIYPDYYLSHFGSNADYGFVGTLVNMRRVNSPSSVTYFPVSYDPNYGLLQFETVTPNELSFVNYYDGIYTGRAFDKNKLEYATIAYAPVMTDSNWITRLSHLQASYSLQKEVLLAQSGISAGQDRLLLTISDVGDVKEFRYTLKGSRKGDPDIVWVTHHAADRFSRTHNSDDGLTSISVRTNDGSLYLALDGKVVVTASVTSPTGQNLIANYQVNMSSDARNELIHDLTRDRDYTAFVYDTYLDTSDSLRIRELANTIRQQAHIEIRDDDGTYRNIPADVSLATLQGASMSEAYVQRDRLVRNVIDYIITEMGCKYTITPSDALVDPNLDGVENFLFNTKEGYCVQYASAVTLLLREMGIPARYADGYVASGLDKASGSNFTYSGYVRDNNAHAWVEVWFDGIGWVQYETTPEYYMGLYGMSSAIDDSSDDPGTTDTETLPETEPETLPETEPETLPESGETEPESLPESETEAGGIPVIGTPENLYATLIGAGVLLLIGAIVLILRAIAKRAERAEAVRQDAVTQALEPNFSATVPPEERRAIAMGISDAVLCLLDYMELSPRPGEFREEYAERLTVALTTPPKKKTRDADASVSRLDGLDDDLIEARRRAEREQVADAVLPDNSRLPKIHVALRGMAAEEFGHGMSDEELREVAELYVCLHGQVKKRIPLGKRISLRYFKRKI